VVASEINPQKQGRFLDRTSYNLSNFWFTLLLKIKVACHLLALVIAPQ
jgi:hypothetical protein